jgi:probable phosphoglycerate mutase
VKEPANPLSGLYRLPETLCLARHAESADPTVFHGFESDIELGNQGFRQAKAFARREDFADVDLLISSGQRRSLQTLEPLAERLGLEIHIIRGFHERKVGILQGTPVSTSSGLFSQTRKDWSLGFKDQTTEGAESYNEVKNRVNIAILDLNILCNNKGAKKPLVISHGLTLKILLVERIFGGDAARWDELGPMQNTALWTIDKPHLPNWTPRNLGCLSHLTEFQPN